MSDIYEKHPIIFIAVYILWPIGLGFLIGCIGAWVMNRRQQ
jgi:hypothetical protein